MNQTLSRILWVIAGVLLLIAGVICIADPSVVLVAMPLYLGISMMISGIVDIVIFAKGNRYMSGSGWFLADGILTVLLSLFILFHQTFTMLSIPYIFGMWLLFSGISKFVNSFELKRMEVRGWGWFTAMGVLLAIAGILSFWNPVLELVTMGVLVGVLLIFQGTASILRACFSNRIWK